MILVQDQGLLTSQDQPLPWKFRSWETLRLGKDSWNKPRKSLWQATGGRGSKQKKTKAPKTCVLGVERSYGYSIRKF